ncbi:MAG: HNH endonuclease [Microlunatus sp.]
MLTSWCLDLQITQWVEQLAWARILDVFDAALLRVDEATYRRRAEEAATLRDVQSRRGELGLRTLVARVEAGDDAAFMALVNRVAQCLAEEGDEDPVGVRRSKAIGIIAHQAKLRDLLARHAADPDDPRHPEERVAAHLDDLSDPWAEDDLPPAGWQTERHGNFHQPGFDDLDDLEDYWASHAASEPTDADAETEPESFEEEDADEDDRTWFDQQRDQGQHDRENCQAGSDGQTLADRQSEDSDEGRDHRGACRACGSVFDLEPFTKAGLAACATKAVVHVHVTDQTLIDQHGVLRTADGPITLEQFRRWLTDADPTITIRPVLDPAAVAAVDSYEIPTAIREAVHTRHPGSVWPFSPVAEVGMGGRLDLDHTRSYRPNGPPGQTAVDKLAPLARSEHRAKTVGGWQVRSPIQGAYVWRSPQGLISLVTNQGTLLLGDSAWARQVWQAHPDRVESGRPFDRR